MLFAFNSGIMELLWRTISVILDDKLDSIRLFINYFSAIYLFFEMILTNNLAPRTGSSLLKAVLVSYITIINVYLVCGAEINGLNGGTNGLGMLWKFCWLILMTININ